MRHRDLYILLAVATASACTGDVTTPSPSIGAERATPQRASVFTRFDYIGYNVMNFWKSDGQLGGQNHWLTGEGSFSLAMPIWAIHQAGITQASWPGNKFQWKGDTLFQLVYDHMSFGASHPPGCTFGAVTTYSVGPFSTVQNGCNADWLTSYFQVVKHAVYTSALSAGISGPGYITIPTTHSWTANPSGASGLYWYKWERSYNGWSWTEVCGDTPTCSVPISLPSANFTLRATVWSSRPNDYYGFNTVVYPQMSVAVAPPQPALQVWIGGPSYFDPNEGGTWYAGTSGGYAPMSSYSWTVNGEWAGNATSLSMSGLAPSTPYELGLTVTDASGGSQTAYFTAQTNTGTCPPGSPPGCAETMRMPKKAGAGTPATRRPVPNGTRRVGARP